MNQSRRRPWISLLIAAIGCSGVEAPPPPVHLLVTNSTCNPGPCTAIRVLAFPENQPVTPGGLWSVDLGSVTTTSACLTMPASAKFEVTGPEGTTTYRWTTDRPVSLGALLPLHSALEATPTTAKFVPTSAGGWAVALPGNASVRPAESCSP